MSYKAEISRSNPACITILLDQSGSMAHPFALPGEPDQSKAQGLADAVNRLLGELVLTCTKGTEVYDRFHVGVITYSGCGVSWAPGFSGFKSLSELANSPLRVDERVKEGYDGVGGITRTNIKLPIWFDPAAEGGTPMCQALGFVAQELSAWTQSHPESFPPIVFNITDGESTDGDPGPGFQAVQGLGTQDGRALTFNLLLSNGVGNSIAYPSDEEQLPPGHLATLVRHSSVLPEAMRRRAMAVHEMSIPEGARGVVLNARMVDVVRLLDIGSRPSNA